MTKGLSAITIAVVLVGALFTGGCLSSTGGEAPLQFADGPASDPASDAAETYQVRDSDDHASWYQHLKH